MVDGTKERRSCDTDVVPATALRSVFEVTARRLNLFAKLC
jgi:hypothetical protein